MGERKLRRRRTVLRVVIVAELVVALVTAAGVVFAYQRIDGGISAGEDVDHVVAAPKKEKLPTSELNLVLMGTDSRDCDGCAIDGESGEGGSDTTILLHIAEGRRSAYGISIPRDTLVDRPECHNGDTTIPAATDVMWNEAYALGGPDCTVAQVEELTGVYIDGYISIDFGGFKGMVDAIGGVEVCIPEAIDDEVAHIHFDAGTQTLDGTDALKYVRERHSTANSDLGRMKRQQAFIASMINKVLSAGTLTHPETVYSFATSLADSLETSPELASAGKLVKLAMSMRKADLDNIKFVTAPTTDFPVGDPNWGRLQLTADAQQLWTKVKNDEALGKLGKGAISAKNPNGDKSTAAENGLCS